MKNCLYLLLLLAYGCSTQIQPELKLAVDEKLAVERAELEEARRRIDATNARIEKERKDRANAEAKEAADLQAEEDRVESEALEAQLNEERKPDKEKLEQVAKRPLPFKQCPGFSQENQEPPRK